MKREAQGPRIRLRMELNTARRFAQSWKRLAHVLETDLRIVRAGGAALAQEVHELRQAARITDKHTDTI